MILQDKALPKALPRLANLAASQVATRRRVKLEKKTLRAAGRRLVAAEGATTDRGTLSHA
jgi:hypothetical protein